MVEFDTLDYAYRSDYQMDSNSMLCLGSEGGFDGCYGGVLEQDGAVAVDEVDRRGGADDVEVAVVDGAAVVDADGPRGGQRGGVALPVLAVVADVDENHAEVA